MSGKSSGRRPGRPSTVQAYAGGGVVNVYLAPHDYDEIKAEKERSGLTMSEICRRGLALYYKQQPGDQEPASEDA